MPISVRQKSIECVNGHNCIEYAFESDPIIERAKPYPGNELEKPRQARCHAQGLVWDSDREPNRLVCILEISSELWGKKKHSNILIESLGLEAGFEAYDFEVSVNFTSLRIKVLRSIRLEVNGLIDDLGNFDRDLCVSWDFLNFDLNLISYLSWLWLFLFFFWRDWNECNR